MQDKKETNNQGTIGVLRFGIPSLDSLFGDRPKDRYEIDSEHERPNQDRFGIHLNDKLDPTSLSILGPDGTGKSALALHLASRYVADCKLYFDDKPMPKVLYVSTDLTHSMAQKMWINFALDFPCSRIVPFAEEPKSREFALPLNPYSPLDTRSFSAANEEEVHPLSAYLSKDSNPNGNKPMECEVCFVDLAAMTAGDDWGFINRILAILEKPRDKEPKHLMVIDSVAGFETMVGDRDAFGESRPRRSRVAQVMRSAFGKCHIAFIVEEPKDQERLPEEFVTDVVIRLRTMSQKDYVRRTVEIDKIRGQGHVRGQHPYLIRTGRGSSTGEYENRDDPRVLQTEQSKNRPEYQSYIHVCVSLHNQSRAIMEEVGRGTASYPSPRFAAFGIPYLDDILGGESESVRREGGDDKRGLPCSTMTAIIGDASTQKSKLGVAFLGRCFTEYARRFCAIVDAIDMLQRKETWTNAEELRRALYSALANRIEFEIKPELQKATLSERKEYKNCTKAAWKERAARDAFKKWLDCVNALKLNGIKTLEFEKINGWLSCEDTSVESMENLLWVQDKPKRGGVQKTIFESLRRLELQLQTTVDITKGAGNRELEKRTTPAEDRAREILKRDILEEKEQRKSDGPDKHNYSVKLLQKAAWVLAKPSYPCDGLPVLLTTQDSHASKLASDFLKWLSLENPELERLGKKHFRFNAVLKRQMEEFTLCRRLEIHDLPAAILIHIMESTVTSAQHLLRGDDSLQETEKRFEKSWGIRVVFDDFSIFRHIYTEVRDDPLVLPFIMFYLGREGVTSVVIDTQAGRPDTIVTEPFDSELRALVTYCVYTWRFTFYGEDRIAIAAIPPISPSLPVRVRELRREPKAPGESRTYTLRVDPHFELYTGIEEGKPRPVPLEVRLFAETPAFKEYIREENITFNELFTPLESNRESERGQIIVGVPATEYDHFRDFCYLQRDTRLDHTLVFQVDEFWALRKPVGRRTGAFRPQWSYLNAITNSNQEPDLAADPYEVFQETGASAGQPSEQNDPASKNEDRQEVPQTEWSETNVAAASTQHQGSRRQDEPAGNDKDRREIPETEVAETPVSAESTQQQDNEQQNYRSKEQRRLKYFKKNLAYKLELKEIGKPELVDRIPFMWDFGFLLCRRSIWEKFSRHPLPVFYKRYGLRIEVGDIWHNLAKSDEDRRQSGEAREQTQRRPSWREFLEACKALSRAQSRISVPVPAFDIALTAPQTLSCLVLEVWASEIYESRFGRMHRIEKVSLDGIEAYLEKVKVGAAWKEVRQKLDKLEGAEYSKADLCEELECIKKDARVAVDALEKQLAADAEQAITREYLLRGWKGPSEHHYFNSLILYHTRRFNSPEAPSLSQRRWDSKRDEGLIKWLEKSKDGYRLELFKTWLLLVEVLDLSHLAESPQADRKRETGPSCAVAVRHWYKTACQASQDFSPNDPAVPVGLPGHFSVRGDWFLAVAGGSRSERLADRALDLLSSRRANLTRLEQGLGLPTRDVIAETQERKLRTGLFKVSPDGRKKRSVYGDLLDIGPVLIDGNQPDDRDFFWLWRSGLSYYYRHARVWQKWLDDMIRWWYLVRLGFADDWMSGFEWYDAIDERDEKALQDDSGKNIRAWEKFNEICDSLLAALKQAVPPEEGETVARSPTQAKP
jgi:KaiC/GvpD/RAD55 family RecA-like ATPase